jgi:hypothetical protein
MYLGLHGFTSTVRCGYSLATSSITHIHLVKEWSALYLVQVHPISPKQSMPNLKLARPEICTMSVLYLLIRRTSGAVIRLVGKPRLGYIGSHVIRAREVAIPPRHMCSFAGAASLPEFAIIKCRRWTLDGSALTRVKNA